MISLFQKSIRNLENVKDFEKGEIHIETINFITIYCVQEPPWSKDTKSTKNKKSENRIYYYSALLFL
jgi:hypothetical protein